MARDEYGLYPFEWNLIGKSPSKVSTIIELYRDAISRRDSSKPSVFLEKVESLMKGLTEYPFIDPNSNRQLVLKKYAGQVAYVGDVVADEDSNSLALEDENRLHSKDWGA